MRESLLNRGSTPATFNYKESPVQVFSGEFCEILENSFLKEHLRATASDKATNPKI